MKKVILEIFKEQRKILEVLTDFDHNKLGFLRMVFNICVCVCVEVSLTQSSDLNLKKKVKR